METLVRAGFCVTQELAEIRGVAASISSEPARKPQMCSWSRTEEKTGDDCERQQQQSDHSEEQSWMKRKVKWAKSNKWACRGNESGFETENKWLWNRKNEQKRQLMHRRRSQLDEEQMGREGKTWGEREIEEYSWEGVEEKRRGVGLGTVVMSHHQAIIPQWAGLLWGWQSDTYVHTHTQNKSFSCLAARTSPPAAEAGGRQHRGTTGTSEFTVVPLAATLNTNTR